jgi:predicted ATPase/DNA-binding SARP family transcriptional activator
MGYLSLKLFDGFQAYLDDKHLTGFESDKSRALLAYLAVENTRAHRREKLANLLWPEMSERRARASLSQALYNLRALLGERDSKSPLFKASPQQVQLCDSGRCQVDVLEFKRLYQFTEQHPHRQIETCPPCVTQLQDAINLCSGRFLDGFSIPDSYSFEEWILLTRERLQHLTEKALHTLANHHARHNNYPRAIEFARRQIELDPWREAAHRQLMHFLVLDGQRSAALAQYKSCCKALTKELNVQPQAKTTDLFHQIRDGEVIHAPFASPPHNLPASLTPFVGRDAEIRKLRQHLNEPACRLITLVGVGGSGKTRLALEAAQCELHSYPHGVFLVSLAPLQAVTAIDPTVADALGVTFHESEDPHQQLLETFRKKSILLIMDNFEHLLDGVDWVLELLRFAPDVTVLATSRTRLNVKGEHIMFVEGLDFPEGKTGLLPSKRYKDYSAIQLFVGAAQRIYPGFDLSQKNAPAIAKICQLVQGMPLALLLAAGGTGVYTPHEIADQIHRSFDILDTKWRDLPPRQRSMRAVLDHSWNMLNKQEREVMQGLSIFRGGFTRQAAEQIVGAAPVIIQGLVNKIFLQHTPQERFDIHELTRQYAAEKLTSNKTIKVKIRDLHAEFYIDAIRRWEQELKTSLSEEATALMDIESENIRAAWNWVISSKEYSLIAQGIEGMCIYYDARVRYIDGQIASQNAVNVLKMKTCDSYILTRIRAQAWLAHFIRQLENIELAQTLLEECFNLLSSDDLHDTRNKEEVKAFIHLEQGYLTLLSDRQSANHWFQESLKLYQSIGDEWGETQSWRGLARSPLTWAVAVNRARSGEKEKA